MKVAHVMRRFAPSDWGGSEAVVFHLCREVDSRGIASPIFCTDALSHPGEDRYFGVCVKRFRYCFPWFFLGRETKNQLARKGGNPLSFSLFFSLLLEKDLSLIHTHVQLRLGGIARTVARLRGIPYVVTLHSGYLTLPTSQAERMMEPTRGKWEWGKFFGALLGSRRVLENASAIICVGRDEYAAMRVRYPEKRIHYVPNGVDIKTFAEANADLFRTAAGLGEHERMVLCVSRIDYQKNQLLLVRTFARFAKRFPEYRLVLIGPTSVASYRQELLDEAETLGIGSKLILIDGYGPHDPLLASAYQAADIFVLPSATEPFGIVILEAWASGVPVIASRVGGIPGFTRDHKDVLLFESGNEGELLRHLESVAENESLRQQLIANGCQSVKSYDWSSICDQVLSIYKSVSN